MITPAAGYQVDPNNPNGVIRSTPVDNTVVSSQPPKLTSTTPSPLATAATSPAPIPTSTATPTQTPQPVTAFSSDSGAATAADNTQKLAQLSSGKGITVGADGVPRYADNSVVPAAPMGATENGNGKWQLGDNTYDIAPQLISNPTNDPQVQQINDTYAGLIGSTDANTKAQLDGIANNYNNLINKANASSGSQTAAVQLNLLSSGTSRYAGADAASVMNAWVKEGFDTIQQLEGQESDAINAARRAQDSGNLAAVDSALGKVEQYRSDKQAAADKLNQQLQDQAQKLADSQAQATKDNAITSVMATGVTDPAKILAALRQQGDTTTNLKDITDTLGALNPDAKAITDLMTSAAKNGASPDILKAIGASTTVAGAIAAAGTGMIDPTSAVGQYKAYTDATTAKGQTPLPYQKWSDANAAKKAYNDAYATKSAQNQADSAFSSSDANQQKLEQEYRTTLLKEVANKTGIIGTQSAKVDQANHLKALVDQYKDANGDYNIPTSQYAELAIGLATLVSPGNTTSDADRAEIKSKTANGDIAGALQYITGQPQTGNTQAIIKNLIDSIDRQGQVAQQSRDQDVEFIQGLKPTDLSSDRASALEKNLLPSYGNISNDPVVKATQDESLAASAIKAFDAQSSTNQKMVDDLHTKFPNASATDIKAALGI